MDAEFKLIPTSKQNVILLRVINSTAYSWSNYSACGFHKLLPPSFSYSPLLQHFMTLLHRGQKLQRV